MSIPNLISLARLLAVPVAVWLILIGELEWAFWLFVLAAVSDAADGLIARLFHARSQLGAYLDPLADKALLVSVYLALGRAGLVPVWLTILVVFRDVLIIGGVLLLYALEQTIAMQPVLVSKANTLAQVTLAGTVLAVNGIGANDLGATRALIWIVAATTVLSGATYIARGMRLMARIGGTS